MAYITFQPHDYFNTVLWSGNGSAGRDITGVGFQPDWVWVKNRSRSSNHTIVDVLRGSGSYPMSSTNNGVQDTSDTNQVSALISDGFTVGSSTNTNASSENLVGWSWRAGGSGSSNTDGSINTTATSVNTTAGFSICKWTGTGANATIGHGLGAVPKMYIVKNVDTTNDWNVYHHNIGNTHRLFLNTTAAKEDNASAWNDTSPTSSVFSVGTNTNVNQNGDTMIAYVFAEKSGFSKFGKYVGNGNADGQFIYTGFKPAWLMLKQTGTQGWFLVDNKRANPFNPIDGSLHPNSNAAEDTSSDFFVDFLANGFKLRDSDAQLNGNNNDYIYAAFAAEPLVSSNNIPATAR
tara:strand:+ start:343 stop:1386 length:1044 start_codon:yes stop_codon:yes gene_type:complete